MAKYDPLFAFLKAHPGSYWRPSMTEIEKVLGFPLPDSAKRHAAWWANQRRAVQANAWLDAGWETSDVTPGGRVTFKRVNSGVVIARSPSGMTRAEPSRPAPPREQKQEPRPVTGVALEPDDDEIADAGTPSDWFWEGHIVDAIERHLIDTGWMIVSKTDTASRARGIDLVAQRFNEQLLVEAKGYPSTTYRDPARAAEIKKTAPTNQAQHWYSNALLTALRLQTKNPGARVALAFPDFPRYRKLFTETESGLRKLGLVVMFIFENGRVETVGL